MGETTGANYRMAACKAEFCNTSSNKSLLAWFSHKWRSGVGMDDGAGLPAELPKLD